MEDVFSSLSTVNLIIAGKTAMPQWLHLEQARKQLNDGVMIWDFATNSETPDVVVSSAGDYMTYECMAGIDIIRQLCPELKYRFVNILTLTCQGFGCSSKLCLTDEELCNLYTKDREIHINFHGYPEVMKQLVYGSCLATRTDIRGYIEKGTTTTPFDMQIKNETSRYHVAISMLQKAAKVNSAVSKQAPKLIKYLELIILKHKSYIEDIGDDMPEVKNWVWGKSDDKIKFDNDNM